MSAELGMVLTENKEVKENDTHKKELEKQNQDLTQALKEIISLQEEVKFEASKKEKYKEKYKKY